MKGIIVRIIERGPHYNAKVRVSEILDKYTAQLQTTEGLLLTDVREKHLETVMPKLEGQVMVLKGAHRGLTAKLLSRDKKANEVTLLVNNAACDILKCSQDDCSAI